MANRDILVLNTTQSRAETQQSSDTVRIKGGGEILSVENSSASPILTVQSSGSQTTLSGSITSTGNLTGVITGSFGKVEGTGTGLDDMIHTTIQSSDGKSGKQAARVAREEAVLTPESLRYIDKHFGTGKGDLGNAHKMFANLQQNVRNQKTGGRQPGPLIKEGASVEKGLSQLFQKA